MSRRVACCTVSTVVAAMLAAPPGVRAQAPAAHRTADAPGARSGSMSCRIDGVWDLTSVTVDGKDQPLQGRREQKFVDRGHFMWVSEPGRSNVVRVRNAADSSRTTPVTAGAGTYTLAGNTYTEHLELFFDPRRERQSLPATCRTEGDRWYHTYSWPDDPATASGHPPQTTEVWRRVR